MNTVEPGRDFRFESVDVRTVERLCREAGAREVLVAVDAADRMRLWQGRKKAFGAMGRISPHLVVQDAVVPRTRLGVQEDGKKLALVRESVSLQQLVDGLNALGIGPRDMISILQAIKASGAIQADIEVM